MTETLFDLSPRFDQRLLVRQIPRGTADRWFGAYHYAGPPGPAAFFGAFAPDLIGVLALSPEGGSVNTAGVAQRLGLADWPGNREIARLAVHPDAPKYAATRVLAACCRAIRRAFLLDWLFSYADAGQNHHGGIYQGLNAVYAGLIPATRGYVLDGRVTHPREIVSRFGSRSAATIERLQRGGEHRLR